VSGVQVDKKSIYTKNKKVNLANNKWYKEFFYADFGFPDTDFCHPTLYGNIQYLSFLQSNTLYIAKKAAICLSKIAAFLLTKTAYFRLLVCYKKHSTFATNILSNAHTNNKLLFQKLKPLNESRRSLLFVSFWLAMKDAKVLEKLGFITFLGHSTRCRSPPSVLFSHKKTKRRFLYGKDQFAGLLPFLLL